MKIPIIQAFTWAALAGVCFAQETPETSPEKAAVDAYSRAFEAAYAKGDVKAVSDLFTDDVEFTTDDGRLLKGKEQIEQTLKAAFATNKGAKLAINVASVKALSPEILVEKGSTTVTSKDGEVTGALYTAVHTKGDGKWKISELVETPLPEETAHDQLSELAWLVGEWEEADKSTDLTIRSQFGWARGGNFLTRNVTVKRAGNVELEGWQIIGWDPVEERIRSWTFDSGGGFSEGRWTRDGERWLLRDVGVAPDGSRTTADNTFTKLSDDKFSWESNNRTLNGEPQPGIGRIEINRAKGE